MNEEFIDTNDNCIGEECYYCEPDMDCISTEDFTCESCEHAEETT